MELVIDGVPRGFVDVRAFRARFDLPPEFGVGLFEPKDDAGLGRIDRAGAVLNELRATVLAAVPAVLPRTDALDFPARLAAVFRVKLEAINAQIGLRAPEIDFAAAGFEAVMQAWCAALLRAAVTGTEAPPFMAVYGQWLAETVRVSTQVHTYGDWRGRVVNHAYGRAGLIVMGDGATHYVADASLACPAEGFMAGLLAAIAARLTMR